MNGLRTFTPDTLSFVSAECWGGGKDGDGTDMHGAAARAVVCRQYDFVEVPDPSKTPEELLLDVNCEVG